MSSVQQIPSSGPERERLREKGQFWTPAWVASAMVSYALSEKGDSIFDPAVGAGAFFLAAKNQSSKVGRAIRLEGTELHADALDQAIAGDLERSDLTKVEIRDFVLDPPPRQFPAIVANPPYIRHHRLSKKTKGELRAFGVKVLGKPLDGRAGIHNYFLLRALTLLEKHGRLAFIVPADTVEGVFSNVLWKWITANFRLDAIITFGHSASPFPKVDTNPVILMIKNAEPNNTFWWARCQHHQTAELDAWVASRFSRRQWQDLFTIRREIPEALRTGLSREPRKYEISDYTLRDFAFVQRGIATGANDFFFFNTRHARDLQIPEAYLLPAIGRTRDVTGEILELRHLQELDQRGRPTLLLAIGAQRFENLPAALKKHIEKGEASKLHRRPLISSRRPWYKMEVRRVPPILFAYLGRRNARFVRNLAGVVPLTGFLCVYPKIDEPEFIDRLWRMLSHPKTLANLSLVGKSYGGGAIKVEPRALERLPIPYEVAEQVGISRIATAEQLTLCSFD